MNAASRERLHEVIFEADTKAGKAFDIGLLGLILASVIVVMLDSVESLAARFHYEFLVLEWVFTGLFTIEYALRLYCVRRPWAYARSLYGIVDLCAVLPTYLSLLIPGSQSLAVVRVLRVVRVFRVLKLVQFIGEAKMLQQALRGSAHKIIVFLVVVLSLAVIAGSVMYVVEGATNERFSNIPTAVYWAVVTLTTVGYGDVTPESPMGRLLATVLMVAGYGIIAVPTGIVTAELVHQPRIVTTQACPYCVVEGHRPDAVHCFKCGKPLNEARNREADMDDDDFDDGQSPNPTPQNETT